MRSASRGAVWIVLWLAVAAVTASRPEAQPPQPLADAVVIESVPAPGAARALTFAQGHLWSIGAERDLLVKIDPATGALVGTLRLEIETVRALAWDGRSFWCAAEGDSPNIYQVDPATGRTLRSIYRPPRDPANWPPTAIEALAWDGKYLWVAFEAGLWSSRLVRLDVADGRAVQSMNAHGIPLGLASDGQSLWMATYDAGSSGRSLLAHWTILDSGMTVSVAARLPGKEPVGLAWDGRALWYADRQQKQLTRLQLPAPRQASPR
jgi:hypothetical protein